MLGAQESELARTQKQRQRKFELDKITKERQAAREGMFGPISRTT